MKGSTVGTSEQINEMFGLPPMPLFQRFKATSYRLAHQTEEIATRVHTDDISIAITAYGFKVV